MRYNVSKIAAKSFRKEKYSNKPSSDNDWFEARKKRLKIDNYSCTKCNSQDRVQVHHIISVSRGGSHAMNNLITLCGPCHQKQHRHRIRYL
jgi:5-methylcytosine-specific restriction endonuclease McrA